MRTKQVTIGGKQFTIKKLTFGDKNNILDQSSEVDMKTGALRFLSGKLRTYTVIYGVLEPKMTIEEVEMLEPEVGEELYNEILAFNEVAFLRLARLGSSTKESQ